ncbi:TPA_asm: 8 kDa protein [Triticum polonicum closterovirus]|nr:TPA_asm: 8 kDa protein [Triticum polonicum closterovirus]
MGSYNNTDFHDQFHEVDPHVADVELPSHQGLECETHNDSLTKLDKWTFAVLWASAVVTVAVLVAGFVIYVV